MPEEEIIANALADHLNGKVISDLAARVLASNWHGGQTSSLYSLTSCGATVKDPRVKFETGMTYAVLDQNGDLLEGTRLHWVASRREREYNAGSGEYEGDDEDRDDTWHAEITEPLSPLAAEIDAIEDAEQSAALLAYVESVGPRGPQPEWSQLNW